MGPSSESQLQPAPASIPTPILTLPNCLVRAYHPQDAEQMVLAANSPLIAKNMRNTFPSPYTLDSANNWINLATSSPPMRNFGILAPDGQTFLGGVGLRPLVDIECRTYEVGYWIAPSAWGRGLATEVLKAFSRWAFETFEDVLRLEAGVFATNLASAKVLSKAGFVHEGTRRRAIWKNGEVLDIRIYGLLREECLGEQS
ncbi:acyl-CoA N-acyltransferase [Coniochaeta ligniaria NRRL 30616]|uniref:Acyl-CoA N-acyltransferase n=1 Tax=Coniochaeta ligniaria NRRL 30616 TaxID=1408157 RepID=A0A1J7J6M8_9PEZI|nr:acyl-CoA N-acyltransferase [Coniochaeta ligniaria NRRL 30616]